MRRSSRRASRRRFAALLAWAGPPGHRPRRPRLPAGRLPRPRLHALEQLLVRGPLQLRHLQPPLLPAGGRARDPPARGRDGRDRHARLRRPGLAGMGPAGALVEPDVRGRLGGDRPLRRLPVRARRRTRPARALGAPGAAAVALRRARRADRRREPDRVPPAHAGRRRAGDRPAIRPLAPARRRLRAAGDRRARGAALARVPGERPLPVLDRGARGRVRVLRALGRVRVAGRAAARAALRLPGLRRRLSGLLLPLDGRRREHRPAALRGDPAQRARALAAELASARPGADRARARDLLERDAARGVLRAAPRTTPPLTPPTGSRRSRTSTRT